MRVMAIEAVCELENVFPTSILDTQVHLIVHLADEVAYAGTVHSRWMFFLERFMKVLKGYVRQRARPEGSMAEGWLVQESMFYITEFLLQVNPHMPRLWDDGDDPRVSGEVGEGKGKRKKMSVAFQQKVNTFCLYNCGEMEKWLKLYEVAKSRREEERKTFRSHNRGKPFPLQLSKLPPKCSTEWLEDTLTEATERGEIISRREEEFARGCDLHYNSFNAMWAYGYHFRVEKIDEKRKTFDRGVMANFSQESQASAKDLNLIAAEIDYVGTIQDILEVNFRAFKVFMFDVKWFKVICRGAQATVRKDSNGFFAIDSTKILEDLTDTFVLPFHCEQVIFQPDHVDIKWWYVIQIAPRKRHVFEGVEVEQDMDDEVDVQVQQQEHESERESDRESNTSNTREESGSESEDTFSSSDGFSDMDVGDDLNLESNDARDLVVENDQSIEDSEDSNSEGSKD